MASSPCFSARCKTRYAACSASTWPASSASSPPAKEAREQLAIEIEQSKDLFEKPRTRTLHGVKVGYTKGKGRIVWDDEAKVIERIRAQLPKVQAELLIRSTEAVHKPAVYDLVAADLKRLGIRIEGDGDEIVIKDATGDVDKLVEALLADVPEEVAA